MNPDRSTFLFTLFNNGVSEPKMFPARRHSVTTNRLNGTQLYCVSDNDISSGDGLWVYSLNANESNISNLSHYFGNDPERYLNVGTNFTPIRLIVLEMN